jgi:RNA polymerase sigma factor (TIGR02999 family)
VLANAWSEACAGAERSNTTVSTSPEATFRGSSSRWPFTHLTSTPTAANAAVATRSARAKTAHGTPVLSYVKTVTNASAWGLRDSARPAAAIAIQTIATANFLVLISLLLARTRKKLEIGAKILDNWSRDHEPQERSVGVADVRGEVTELLGELKLGRKETLDRLMPLVYRELRRIAGHQMRDERVGHTLQPTALVHEAFLRLVDQSRADWQNRAQFLGVSAQLMRRLLVDHARRRRAAKRGIPVTLNEEIFRQSPGADQTEEILAVDEVLARLAALDPRQARVVELRYFGGLSVEETAEAMGIAPRTVKLDWAMAKGWMKSQLSPGGPQ